MADKKDIVGVSSMVGNSTITIEPDKIMGGADEFLLTFRINGIGGKTCVTIDDQAIDLLESAIKLYKVANRR